MPPETNSPEKPKGFLQFAQEKDPNRSILRNAYETWQDDDNILQFCDEYAIYLNEKYKGDIPDSIFDDDLAYIAEWYTPESAQFWKKSLQSALKKQA